LITYLNTPEEIPTMSVRLEETKASIARALTKKGKRMAVEAV
jgi:hypothetical protein